MAGMWDGLVPWNRSRSFTNSDLLSFFICSFCLGTKKEWRVTLVQMRTVSQQNSFHFWVTKEQWHKPLSVGLLPVLHFVGILLHSWLLPAKQKVLSIIMDCVTHSFLPHERLKRQTSLDWIGQFPCYINPECINMFIKLSCMTPQWRLYNIYPYLYHIKSPSKKQNQKPTKLLCERG